MDVAQTAGAERRAVLKLLSLLIKALFSMKTTLILLGIFAFASAVATFVENSYGRDAARELVYNTRWFEAVMTLLTVSALGNIYRYRLWRPKKLPLLVVHFSFLLIFAGAALTRYVGEEGTVHIREGQTVNRGVSYDHYFRIKLFRNGEVYEAEKKRIVSPLTKPGFGEILKIGDGVLKLKAVDYMPLAKVEAVPKKGGEPIVHIILEGGYDVVLRKGSVYDSRMFRFYFGKEPPENERFVKVFFKGDKLYMVSDAPLEWFKMNGEKGGDVKAMEEFPLEQRKVYRREGIVFILLDALKEGELKISRENIRGNLERHVSAMKLRLNYEGKEKLTDLIFVKEGGFTYLPTRVELGDATLEIAYGQKEMKLPFSLKLEDFIIERYPGSNAPSSYESKVVVIDKEKGKTFPYRIYMNHTLDYRGYRFFQMSYDPDERGTVLSFNRDPGVLPTYLGYTLLCAGLVAFLGVRFRRMFAILVLFLPLMSWSFPTRPPTSASEALEIVRKVDRKVAEEFCTLTVQTADGRMETLHTFALEVANKVHGKPKILGLTPCQALLGMMALPLHWQALPVVKVDHPELKKKLGVLPDAKYFAYLDAIGPNRTYKLAEETDQANRKEPSRRTQKDKEALKIAERLSILFMIFTGELPRIFPLEGDPNKTWYGIATAVTRFPKEEAEKVTATMRKFFVGALLGVDRGDWKVFREALAELKEYQRTRGADLVLSDTRVKMEILYNRLNIFERSTLPFLLLGILFFVVLVGESVFPGSRKLGAFKLLLVSLYGLLTAILIVGLGLRWYVADHAPWSNAYESIVFMGASAAVAGLIFMRKSFAPLAGSLMAGAFLFIAHLNWLDPQVTNLVPVLKSYWLIFHAGVTVASYGFLGLAAILGFIGLVFMALPGKWSRRVNLREIAKTAEFSMLVGFVLINIGNILGAVWANESWGRYWGWDPKETWTLITILVYAIVLHLKYTPFYSLYTFLALSMFSYLSVLMTYFGVNFLLSGLHSYASGEFLLPRWVYFALAGLGTLAVLAFRNRNSVREVAGS